LLGTISSIEQLVFARRKVTTLLSCIYLGRNHHAGYRAIACDLRRATMPTESVTQLILTLLKTPRLS
jgi:hypothetical protein